MTITAHLKVQIRIWLADLDVLPDDALAALEDALTIPNLARAEAKKQHQHGWQDMPTHICLWETHDGYVFMPRGFLPQLEAGLDAYGFDLLISDRTAFPKILAKHGKIEYRDHQQKSVDAILHKKQGIVKAPAGAGKTVVVLGAGRDAKTKCLVIVNTKDIMEQWVNRIEQYLPDSPPVGRVGAGKMKIGYEWTIATAQTLHSRYDQLDADGFFDSFGFVCLDESHHSTAQTFQRVLARFSSSIRIGVSATPDKTGDFALSEAVLGPIIDTTKYADMVEAGYLIDPEIIKVKTDFTFSFKGTTSRWQRSNYPQLIKDIIVDEKRNELIVRAITKEAGKHCLVLTKRHDHIDILEDILLEAPGWSYPTARLTGKESASERERVINLIQEEPCCVFSTIADEALDVPRVDRGFLVYPQANPGLLEQQVGRFCRAHPDKKDAKVYDFADLNVPPLAKQWRTRMNSIYRKRKYKVSPPPWEHTKN